MYQELQKRKKDLQMRQPYKRQVAEDIKQLNMLDYICSGMILDGADLTREDIHGMINGEMPKQASLKQCVTVQNYIELMYAIHDSLELKSSLNTRLLCKFHGILTGNEKGFRKSNYLAVDFKYVPPHSSEIEKKLNQLFRDVYKDNTNEIRNAAMIHCGILAIYPFEEGNGMIARLAMNYYLQEKGYLPVSLGYNYDEYMSTMIECLRDGNETLFFWGLERAVFNKLIQVLQIIESAETE